MYDEDDRWKHEGMTLSVIYMISEMLQMTGYLAFTWRNFCLEAYLSIRRSKSSIKMPLEINIFNIQTPFPPPIKLSFNTFISIIALSQSPEHNSP
jgi:hypothetical protein